jgi:hypothetical protein
MDNDENEWTVVETDEEAEETDEEVAEMELIRYTTFADVLAHIRSLARTDKRCECQFHHECPWMCYHDSSSHYDSRPCDEESCFREAACSCEFCTVHNYMGKFDGSALIDAGYYTVEKRACGCKMDCKNMLFVAFDNKNTDFKCRISYFLHTTYGVKFFEELTKKKDAYSTEVGPSELFFKKELDAAGCAVRIYLRKYLGNKMIDLLHDWTSTDFAGTGFASYWRDTY